MRKLACRTADDAAISRTDRASGARQVVGTLRYTGGCSKIHDVQTMPLQTMPGVRRHGISGNDTDTSTLAIDTPEFGLWLDPPSESDPEADAPIAPRATASRAPR
jgi:hypothetical protein